MSGYDSRPETRAHIDRVRYFVMGAELDLERRSTDHDASKLVSPELEAFDVATPKLARLKYGSEEYKQSLRDLGPALQHHFAANDHHPEHYPNGVRGMSLMALIEMLCDWRAASERTKQRDPEKTFESGLAFNQERFGYSDELAEILLNTARELDMLSGENPADSKERSEEIVGGFVRVTHVSPELPPRTPGDSE